MNRCIQIGNGFAERSFIAKVSQDIGNHGGDVLGLLLLALFKIAVNFRFIFFLHHIFHMREGRILTADAVVGLLE